MIDTMNVGKTIAQLRKQKQMTQQGLAAAVNVSHQAVSKWENGGALPDMQTMLALSRLFGVSMEDLLTGALLEAEVPAEPAPEIVKPPIELKLDSGELNMSIVAEADDVIARAMDSIGDDPEAPEAPEAPEVPEAPEASEAPEVTVHVDMTFDEIAHMAPYVSDETLATILENCEKSYQMSDLVAVAPFVSKDMMEKLVRRCSGFDWEALRRLAPFLRRDALRKVILANVDTASWDKLRPLAPFMSRDGLAEVLQTLPVEDDFSALKRLAPFMSRDGLYRQLKRCQALLTIEDVLAFAPYLRKDALGEIIESSNLTMDRSQLMRLAKYLPREQMDRLVYRAMGMKPPRQKSGDWDVTLDLGRAYHDIKDAVHSGMQEARDAIKMAGLGEVMDGINSTMKDVGGRINVVFNSAWSQTAKEAGSRAQRIRARIADKALAEGNWEWITTHAGELTAEQLKQVLMKCAAAGHEELIDQYLNNVNLSSAEACRLAQTVVDEGIWECLLEQMEPEHAQRVLDYIGRTNPELLPNFERFAKKEPDYRRLLEAAAAGNFDDVEMMDMDEQLKLVELVLVENADVIYKMVSSLHPQILPQVLGLMLDAECIYDLSGIAQCANESDLPAMVLMVAERGHWALLDEMLWAIDDVDLSAVWPLAIAQADVVDVIAMHGDANTLRCMSLALADQGRFDEMDSFLEELAPDTLEAVLEKAMEKSDWDAIEKISKLLDN